MTRSLPRTATKARPVKAADRKGVAGTAVRPNPVPEQTIAADDPAWDLPDFATMMSNAREASNFLKAVAHANRLMLLCILARREHSVTELEELLSERQTTVSQQLARLRLDDLVTTRRVGKTVYYRLADDDLIKFIRLIHEMFHKPAGPAGK